MKNEKWNADVLVRKTQRAGIHALHVRNMLAQVKRVSLFFLFSFSFFILMLSLAACRHGDKQPAPEGPASGDTVPPTAVIVTPADTADSVHTADVPKVSRKTGTVKKYKAYRDTMETINLRLLSRKQPVIYSPDQMVGEWQRGNEHEQYIADGTGRHWDTGDDVDRTEAQAFNWTLDSNLLTVKYSMALGGLMVRHYLVTLIFDGTLVYKDAYGDAFEWDLVPPTLTDHPK